MSNNENEGQQANPQDLKNKVKELGMKPIYNAYVLPDEEGKKRPRGSAERMAAKRERDAAQGIKPVSVKVKGDREKQVIDQLAKASLNGNLDAVMREMVGRDPAPQPAAPTPTDTPPLDVQSQKSRLAAAFIAGVIAGAGLLAVMQ